MKKILSLVLSLLLVIAVVPMALVSAETAQTVVYTMDEGSAPSSWSTDKRYTVTPGIIDSGDETYGKVLQLGTFGDQSSTFQFSGKNIDTENGIPTKLTFNMKGGANFNVENGMAFVAGGTWYKVTNSFYTGTSWKTVTIDLTDSSTYYANVQAALSKGITDIAFYKNKGTSYILVDNVTVYTELFSENREEQAKPAAPVVESFTGSTVTLKAVDNALYSIDGGATWQSSNTFTGLKAATDYSFVIKLKQSATHFESPVSDVTIATTAFIYKWNLYSTYFTINSGATLKGGFNTQYQNDGTYFVSQNNQVGDTATFTSINTVAPGIYSANLWARTTGGRAFIDVYVNDVKVKSALNTGNSGTGAISGGNMNYSIALNENTITIEEESTVTLTITTTTTGNLYLNALELAKIGDLVEKPIYKVTINGVEEEYKEGTKISLPSLEVGYHYTDGENDYNPGDVYEVTGDITLTTELNVYDVTIDGEVVATVTHGDTYTVQTPGTGYDYTDGTTKYYGGEEIVVTGAVELTSVIQTTSVVYTMDEGSRMAGGATANVVPSGDVQYLEIDGDYKLAIKTKSDQYFYFKLPADWSSKPYFKPVKISFETTKTPGKNVTFRNIDFSETVNGNHAASGGTYKVSSSLIGAPTNYSFNVTEDMYGYYFISGKFYSDTWSASDPSYAFIDNFKIDYEYDHSYVEPTPEVEITMVSGAQVRFNEVTGLRYRAQVDKAAIDNYKADGYTVTMGTLIAPADYYESYTDMTLDTDKTILNVVTTGYYSEDNGIIAGTIAKIKETNWGRDFIARAYVKLEKDGEVFVCYADDNDNTRSLKQVSISALEDDTVTHTQEQLDLLDKWSKAQDYVAQ